MRYLILFALLTLAACSAPAPADLNASATDESLTFSVEGTANWLRVWVDGSLVAEDRDAPLSVVIDKDDFLPGTHEARAAYRSRGDEISVALSFVTPWRPLYPNDPPVVTVTAPGTAAIGEVVALVASVTDDGRPFGVLLGSWGIVGPQAPVVGDADALVAGVVFVAPGEYIVTYVVTDGEEERSDYQLVVVH